MSVHFWIQASRFLSICAGSIENGELVHGPCDEKAIGASKGEILNKLIRRYGPDGARRFIDHVTTLAMGGIMAT